MVGVWQMSIKEKLTSIKNECSEHEDCSECVYNHVSCCSVGFTPSCWTDGHIDWLASEMERPKNKWVEHRDEGVGLIYYSCPECKWLANVFEFSYWHYCPNCGAELEG